jgi:hypothetical protein
MKKILPLLCVLACLFFFTGVQAQLLKKIKDKVNKGIDNKIDKVAGIDKPTSETEKKENAASDQYSDATENNERPIFVDKAPGNGKMVLQLKNGDRFWGGYIQLVNQPKKADVAANILDFVKVRVGSFFTAGEMSNNAVYIEGNRTLVDSLSIPLRPEFISYQVNKTPYFLSTEAKVSAPSATPGVLPVITPATFSFKWDGKTYGPFEGTAENMFVLKSMTDGKPTQKFYGFGTEMTVAKNEKGKSQMVVNGIVQTETKLLRIKDYVLTTLMPTFPAGIMAFAQGGKVHTFSNGKIVPIVKIAGIADNIMNVYTADNKFYSEIYGTDSGHVVCIVKQKDMPEERNTTEAYINYTTRLNYPVSITKKNLLIASNPAKSVLYRQHTLYYADGTKETIDNVGDAQLINFNGKDYIVWFEMMKAAGGHQVYVCQKELK